MAGTVTNPSGIDMFHSALFERASYFDPTNLNPIRRRHAPMASSKYVVVGAPEATQDNADLYTELEIMGAVLAGDIFAGTVDPVINELARGLSLDSITGRVALVGIRDFSVAGLSEDGDSEDIVMSLAGIRFVHSAANPGYLDLNHLGDDNLPERFDVLASFLSEDGTQHGIVAQRYYHDPVLLTREADLAQSFASIILDCA